MAFAAVDRSFGTSSDRMENDMDFGTAALLPAWILGAPLVLAVIDRFMTPTVGRSASLGATDHPPSDR